MTICVQKIKPVDIISSMLGRNLIKIFPSDSIHRPLHLIQQGKWDLEEIGNVVTGSEGDMGYLGYSRERN